MPKFTPKSPFILSRGEDGIYLWPSDQPLPEDVDEHLQRPLEKNWIGQILSSIMGLAVCTAPLGVLVLGDRMMTTTTEFTEGKLKGQMSWKGKKFRAVGSEIRVRTDRGVVTFGTIHCNRPIELP